MAPSRESFIYSRSELTNASPNAYSFRVPSPPRIIIPPPIHSTNDVPNIDLGRLRSPDQLDLSFLNNMKYKDLVDACNMLGWTYEKRREAQRVLPFLYLGPMAAAKDRAFLQREGITMVLAIQHRNTLQIKLLAGALRVADELGIANDVMNLAGNQELIAAFPRAIYAINKHLSDYHDTAPVSPRTDSGGSIGKVLVFCESGNEKSAAVVAAYLMEMFENVDYLKAMQFCHSQRFSCNFDDGLKNLLCAYWTIVQAKRDVGSAQQSTENSGPSQRQQSITAPAEASLSNKRSKRNLDEVYENDATMEDDHPEANDHARFQRRGFAPFQDREDAADDDEMQM